MTDSPDKSNNQAMPDCAPMAGPDFTSRISVTDGGEPIVFLVTEDGGEIWRGDEQVGIGHDLQNAWNDYLYSLGAEMKAPVSDDELAAMWRNYDSQNAQGMAAGSAVLPLKSD